MAASIHSVLVSGVFGTFCYFVVDDSSGRGLLIDAGAQPELLAETAATAGWHIDAILLTHGHFDHFGAARQLSRLWDAPVWAHENSAPYLEDPLLNLSAHYGPSITLEGTHILEDGQEFPLADGGASLHAIHVPGHTRDSMAFYMPQLGIALVGDTVYEGGPGLTVFPTGDAGQLAASITRLKRELPPETLLLSGHSQPIPLAQL